MPELSQNLVLPRCPHCSVANPNLFIKNTLETNNHFQNNFRVWALYLCGTCGGVVVASARAIGYEVSEYFPHAPSVKDDIPDRPRAYFQQAMESLHAPAGAVMLACSAVDAMLKLKGYTDASLYARIEKAAKNHLITEEMAQWAHDVRLDANDQRHADQEADFPTDEDAKRVLDFATAIAEFLFVLPSRVQRGLRNKKPDAPRI